MSFLTKIPHKEFIISDEYRQFNKNPEYYKPLLISSTLTIEYSLPSNFNLPNHGDNHISVYNSSNMWYTIRLEEGKYQIAEDVMKPESGLVSTFGKWRVAYDKQSQIDACIPNDMRETPLYGYGFWWYYDRGIAMVIQLSNSVDKKFIYYEFIGTSPSMSNIPTQDLLSDTTNDLSQMLSMSVPDINLNVVGNAPRIVTTVAPSSIPNVPIFTTNGEQFDFPKIDVVYDYGNLSANVTTSVNTRNIGTNSDIAFNVTSRRPIVPPIYWFSERERELEQLNLYGVGGGNGISLERATQSYAISN